MKKLLLTLLLGVSLLNTTTSYSAAITEYTDEYDIELYSFEDDEGKNDNFGIKY